MPKKQYKIVLIGSSGAGKTSIAVRMMKNKFDNNNNSTIGASYFSLKKNYIDPDNIITTNDNIELQIWDTAGQERYKCLIPMYLRKCDVIIIVYDIIDPNYKNLNYWIKYVNDMYENNENKPIIYLVGNKFDLLDNKDDLNAIKLKKDEIIKNIKLLGCEIKNHILVSAKLGYKVKELFYNIYSLLIKNEDDIGKDESIILEIEKENNIGICCKY